MIINLSKKGIQVISQERTFIRWRRKPAVIDMERNYVTATLCIWVMVRVSICRPSGLSFRLLVRRTTTLLFDIIAVATGDRKNCLGGPTAHLVSAITGTGYLSSLVTSHTGVGAADCPWLLRAGPGQRISLSLLDFTVTRTIATPPTSQAAENEASLKVGRHAFKRLIS